MSDYSSSAVFILATRKLGLPLPAEVQEADARRSALVSARLDLTKQQADARAEISSALLAAGPDTDKITAALTGKAALRLTILTTPDTAQALATAVDQADRDLRRAIVNHGDDIILGWRATVERVGADITAAAAALPGVDSLDDFESVTRSGADAAGHWAKATAATALLTKVGQLLDALNATGYDLTPKPGGMVSGNVVRMARLTWQHVEDRTALSLWAAARAGAKITLHTSADLHAVMAQIVNEHEANLTPIERRLREKDRVPVGFRSGF